MTHMLVLHKEAFSTLEDTSCLLETLSHTFEEIPPYVNGKDRWESRYTFLHHGGWWRIAGFVSFSTLFTIVSIVSNLHLLPTMKRFQCQRSRSEKMDKV